MSVSKESPYDDRQLTRYLLGQLAEEEAERLDELAIVDDAVAWHLRALENDLVDAYVRGTLDAESRQHFETYYLASPKRRERVRFAERFVRAADATVTPAEQTPEPLRGALASASSPLGTDAPRETGRAGWLDWLVPQSTAGWGFVYGAAALLLIVSGLLVMRDLRLGRALSESEQQRVALERRTQDLEDQLVEQRAATAETERVLEQARAAARNPASQRSPDGAPSAPGSAGSPVTTLALVLWPQTRSATGSNPGAGTGTGTEAGAGSGGPGAAAPAVAVSPEVDHVALELQLESPDFSRYSVTLKEPGTNRIVWRTDRVTAPIAGEAPVLSVAAPANLLKSQTYMLELTGFGPTGGGEVIGSYVFQIVRR
jgi:hypothetical protein